MTYSFKRICMEEPDLTLPDETEFIFISSKGDRTGLSERACAILDYMNGHGSSDPLIKRIEDRISAIKKSETEERDYVTYEMRLREERAEGRKEGRKEGADGKANEFVMMMLKDSAPVNKIKKYSGWTDEKIRSFANQHNLIINITQRGDGENGNKQL